MLFRVLLLYSPALSSHFFLSHGYVLGFLLPPDTFLNDPVPFWSAFLMAVWSALFTALIISYQLGSKMAWMRKKIEGTNYTMSMDRLEGMDLKGVTTGSKTKRLKKLVPLANDYAEMKYALAIQALNIEHMRKVLNKRNWKYCQVSVVVSVVVVVVVMAIQTTGSVLQW